MIREPSSRPWLPLFLVILGLLILVLNEAGLLTPVESALHYVLDPLQRVFAGGGRA